MEKNFQNDLNSYLVNKCNTRLEEIYNNYYRKIDDVFSYIREKNGVEFIKFHKFYIANLENINNVCNNDYFKTFISKYQIRGLSKNYRGRLIANNNEIKDLLKDEKLFTLYIEYFHNQQTRMKNTNVGFSDQGCFFGKLIHLCYPNEYAAIDNAQRKLLNSFNNLFIIDFFIINKAYNLWIKNNPEKMKTIRDAATKALLDINIKKTEIENYSNLRMLDVFLMGGININ